MNIYLHELRSYRKNTIIWIISMCVVTFFFFSLYPAFSGSAADVVKILQAYPEAVTKALGIDVNDIATVTGFYSFILTFITLSGAVQAIYLGISVIAKETTGKTADFLLTKPVKRKTVITAKLLCVFTCIAITSALYMVVSGVCAQMFKTGDFDQSLFLRMSLSFFFIQVIFAAMGFIMAVVVRKIKSVLPVALSTVFALFSVGAIGAALQREEFYFLSPFKYFDPVYMIQHNAYHGQFVIVGAAFVLLAVVLSYALFVKKDIHAV